MNERIKELKHQASLWCDKNIPEQYSEETNGYGRVWEDKFAVLIIQECARKVEDMIDNGWYADTGEMKEHFGVE